MLHVIVTGPESVGKTTLSRDLAARAEGVWVPEYPRGYLSAAGRPAVPEDFPHFARVLNALTAAARQQSPPVLVQDTGYEVLLTWARDKFALEPAAVSAGWRGQRPDVYVLCQPDLPWVYDPLRVDPHRRQELFHVYRDLLAQTGIPVVEAKGKGKKRLSRVAKFIDHLGVARIDWGES